MSEFPHMPTGLQPGAQNLVNIYNAVRAGFPPVCAQANYFPAYAPGLLTPPQAHIQPPLMDSHNSARTKVLPSQSSSRQLPPPLPPPQSQTMKVASEIPPKVDDLIASEIAEASTSQSASAEDQELMKAYPIYKKSEDIDQEEEETANSKHSEEDDDDDDDDDDEEEEEEEIGATTRKRRKKRNKSKKSHRPVKSAKKEEEVTPRCKRCKKFMSTDNERNTFPMSTDGYCVYCNKAKTITEETRKEYINNSMCYLCGKTYGRPRNCMEHLRDVHREPAQVVFGRRSYENRLKACYYAKGTFLK